MNTRRMLGRLAITTTALVPTGVGLTAPAQAAPKPFDWTDARL